MLCITQVKNLEDELLRSCSIKQIKELTGSKSNSDYKHDLIKETNLKKKLEKCKFDINKFWSQSPKNEYRVIENNAGRIKNR